jgi:hypothetical protein
LEIIGPQRSGMGSLVTRAVIAKGNVAAVPDNAAPSRDSLKSYQFFRIEEKDLSTNSTKFEVE